MYFTSFSWGYELKVWFLFILVGPVLAGLSRNEYQIQTYARFEMGAEGQKSKWPVTPGVL